MKKVKLAAKFCLNFGLFKGLWLFIKFQAGFTEKVKLPAIKYPISLRPGTSDAITFRDIFLDNQYNVSVRNPKIIIDGGANIGLFTVLMKNKYPDAKIIAIEPDGDNFMELKKNASPYQDVFFENYGIWNTDTKLKVYDKYNRGKWGVVVEEDPENGTIPAISIHSLMKKYQIDCIDILKLDIEASEKQLFLNHYEEWLPKVKKIVIELHDGFEEDCSRTFFEAINKAIPRYKLHTTRGENLIIENLDIA
ncbi:FkbM family methyltransferase [Flavobacterium sp. XGLA_31]|uniref:FkbM family methyltransferase n=1 Tax=Flavobacterium sp. XGLA_31 TaxID=3447666 RepID=UPI003F37D832